MDACRSKYADWMHAAIRSCGRPPPGAKPCRAALIDSVAKWGERWSTRFVSDSQVYRGSRGQRCVCVFYFVLRSKRATREADAERVSA